MTVIDTFAAARRHNITPSMLHTLVTVMAHPGITSIRLADEMACTTSNVTCMVDRLEKASWVKRVRSGHDRRKVFLFPTQRAESVFLNEP